MASVTLKNIKKIYGKSVVAVHDMDLEIADKEFIVLVGPSGCGKSTTLRMIAGLEEITAGDMYIADKRVNNVEPKNRNIAMVFQNYALYPHMTVYDNIAFGLRMRRMPRKLIDEKVRAAAEILEISELLKRKPKALSGGQRQRVAIGRAIVRDPDVFLMDEPLSNLDAKLRGQMRTELIKLRRRLDTTFVYVTHDQTEAMTLGDRIVVMNNGYVMQVGTPQEVFDRPANTFVAGFIGTPQMNFLKARLCAEGEKRFILYADERIELPGKFPDGGSTEREVTVGIRPEHISVSESSGLPAVIEVRELMGSTVDLHLRIGDDVLEAIIPSSQAKLLPQPDPAIGVAPFVRLRLEAEQLHLFDPESGNRIEPEEMTAPAADACGGEGCAPQKSR